MQVRGRTAGLRQGTAAGCRSLRDRVCRQAFSPQSTAAGCGTRSGCKFRIQDSKFRIAQSGCSLRRARSKRPYGTRAAGLRRREAAACSAFSRPISIRREPAAEQWACDVKEQPSARRRLRPTAAPIRAQIHDSEFKIIFGSQPAECTSATPRSCGPPPGGGCGPLGPDGPIPAKDKPAAERTGSIDRKGVAALRPGAAAGCCGSLSEPQIHLPTRTACSRRPRTRSPTRTP